VDEFWRIAETYKEDPCGRLVRRKIPRRGGNGDSHDENDNDDGDDDNDNSLYVYVLKEDYYSGGSGSSSSSSSSSNGTATATSSTNDNTGGLKIDPVYGSMDTSLPPQCGKLREKKEKQTK